MRILVISNMLPGSVKPAYGIFVHERAVAYARLEEQVRVVGITDPRRGPVRSTWKYCSLVARSLAAAVAFRPDVIEGHYLVPTAAVTALAAAVARRPFVLYAHGSDVFRPRRRALMRLVGWAVGRASEIHTNSPITAAEVRRAFPRVGTIEVIPPGVDTRQFAPSREIPSPAPPPFRIVYVGNIEHHKGVDVLLEALASLSQQVDWTATFAGTGPEAPAYRRLAVDRGIADRIRWMGEVPHDRVPDLLRGAHAVAVPSRRDALGLVAIEALASGTPVVVSDVGGLAAIPTPECGAVVPADEPQALAEALLGWLHRSQDPAVRRAAVERASEFELARVTGQSLERLRSVAAARG